MHLSPDNRPNIITSDPGSVQVLPDNTEIKVPDLKGSDLNHAAYVEQVLRTAAGGINLSYESLSGEYSKSNYSSSRLARLSEHELYRNIQTLIIEKFMTPVFNVWLSNEINQGRLVLTPQQQRKLLDGRALKWIPRSFPYVEPEKATRANVLALQNNLKTRAQILSEEGVDFDSIVKQLQYEEAQLKEYGLNNSSEVPEGNMNTANEDENA